MWFKELNTGGASLQVPACKHVLNSKSLRTRRRECEDVLVQSLVFNEIVSPQISEDRR